MADNKEGGCPPDKDKEDDMMTVIVGVMMTGDVSGALPTELRAYISLVQQHGQHGHAR